MRVVLFFVPLRRRKGIERMKSPIVSPALEHAFFELSPLDQGIVIGAVFGEVFFGSKRNETLTSAQRAMADRLVDSAERIIEASEHAPIDKRDADDSAGLRDEHGNVIELDDKGFPIFPEPEIPFEYFKEFVKKNPTLFLLRSSGKLKSVTEEEVGDWYDYMVYFANWKYKSGLPITKRNFRASLLKRVQILRENERRLEKELRMQYDSDLPGGRGFDRTVLGALCRSLNDANPGSIRQEEADALWVDILRSDFIGHDRRVITPNNLPYYLSKFVREYRKECGYAKWSEWKKRGYADLDHMNELLSRAHIAFCKGEISEEEKEIVHRKFLNDATY